jgi:hypothetical protein
MISLDTSCLLELLLEEQESEALHAPPPFDRHWPHTSRAVSTTRWSLCR